MLSRISVALGVLTLTILLGTLPASANEDEGGWLSQAHDDDIDLGRYLGGEPVDDPGHRVNGIATIRYERQPAVLCNGGDDGAVQDCAWLIEKVDGIDCPANAISLAPLFRSTRTVTDGEPGAWSDWEYVESNLCLRPADLAADVTKAFRSLTIEPSPIHVQPDGGAVLINMFTVTYTEATAETFNIRLGAGDQMIPVEVQAVPTSFTWSYGDGDAPFTTTDPGKPYPDQTVTHTFTHQGASSLGLSTTWTGRFRIEGLPADPADPDTWTAIPGEARTTSATVPVTVYERTPHLVNDTLG